MLLYFVYFASILSSQQEVLLFLSRADQSFSALPETVKKAVIGGLAQQAGSDLDWLVTASGSWEFPPCTDIILRYASPC
jgi:hypothetical protein